MPQDPWAAFADSAAEKPPGRIRRGFRAIGRGFIHEYSVAIYLSLILGAGLTWPTLRYPLHTLPQDLGDPSRQAWQISWLGHVLQTNPVKLWQANAYFPTTDSLAYGDSLLGYAPAGLLGTGPEAAVLRYNILFVLAHALLVFGAYVLVRQLGARPTGAAVAAAAFAYAPWRLAQEGHLDIVSAGAIPLALALLARGHGWSIRYGFRPDRRNSGWAALGWLVATWQLSLGFSLGVPFAYLLGLIVLVLLVVVPIRWLRLQLRARRLRAAQRAASAEKQPATETKKPDAAEQGKDQTAVDQGKESTAGAPDKKDASKDEPKTPESDKPDPAKPEASRPETVKPKADKPEASKPEIEKPEQTKPAPSKPEADKSEAGRPEQSKHEVAKAEQVQNKTDRIVKAEPEQKKDEPGQAEPAKTDPDDKTEPKKAEQDKAGSGKREQDKGEPAEKQPDKNQEKTPEGTDVAGKTGPGGKKRPKGRPERKPKRPRRQNAATVVLGWRLLLADYLGVLIFAGVGAVLAIPYLRVPDSATRSQQIDWFSPPLRSLLIGPAESRIWGAAHVTARSSLNWAAEMSLLPGFMVYALALAGLLFSIWRWRQRLFLIVGLAVAVILTLGTTFFDGRWTYRPLFGHLPASFDQIVPGRLMVWVTLILAILAAGAVDEFVRRAEQLAAQRMPARPGPLLRLATLLPLLLVLLEGWSATAHPVTPAQPDALRSVGGPMLVLPTDALKDQTVQLWTTSRYQQVANGGGQVATVKQNEMRQQVQSFPDLASISYLRSIGVGTVVLIRSEVAGTVWEQAGDLPVDTLGIRREDLPDAVVFRLN
ncbi:hypothetical protein [Actinoplanes sp. HUAS TT8]|uniref:hypothetical protein n=1 Tax=Actinoplanes sp. HUAS TT8 TaxID=3447453 RepID=UPI003F51F65B